MKELRVAAESLSLRLQLFEARGPEEFDGAFAEMTRARMDGLAIMGSTFVPHRAKLAELAITARLPVITFLREFTEAGALLSYGVNLSDFVARAAVYVDRILKGARPADLAVEQPTQFELAINLRTAKALGLTVPPTLLARADEVIE
jgi:putative ABC transport system substrate-binding protein